MASLDTNEETGRVLGIPAECLYYNAAGQAVNICHPDAASGYYIASDNAVEVQNQSGTNLCPNGMRPGRMVIKGIPDPIPTCGGRISQEDMPDIHIVDWRYRVYLNLALAIMVLVLIGAIGIKLMK